MADGEWELAYSTPKLAQVAKIAGVSPATASNVLNGTGRPSQETIARVREVARLLNYEANVNAQSLRTGDALASVAIVVDEASTLTVGASTAPPHTYWYRLFFGLWQALSAQGIGVFTVTTDRLDLLSKVPVSVVLLASTQAARPDFAFLGNRTAVIVAAAPSDDDQAQIRGYMYYDDDATTQLALTYLSARGCNQIALVRGANVPWIDRVCESYEQWCEETAQAPLIFDGTTEITDRLAQAMTDGCDGVFDLTAWTSATLRAADQAGKRIPDDVQVIAHLEDGALIAGGPSLTVVSPDASTAAQQLAELTVHLMNTPRGTREIVLSTQIIPGDTTR